MADAAAADPPAAGEEVPAAVEAPPATAAAEEPELAPIPEPQSPVVASVTVTADTVLPVAQLSPGAAAAVAAAPRTALASRGGQQRRSSAGRSSGGGGIAMMGSRPMSAVLANEGIDGMGRRTVSASAFGYDSQPHRTQSASSGRSDPAAVKQPPRTRGEYYFGTGGRVIPRSATNFTSADPNYRPRTMSAASRRSSNGIGRVSTAPSTKRPDCLGAMGLFNSPLEPRSFKDFTPLLGFQLKPPYVPVNPSRWTGARPARTFTSAPIVYRAAPLPSFDLDRSHTFKQQVSMGEENGRLVKRMAEINTRAAADKSSHAAKPVKDTRVLPIHIRSAAVNRRRDYEIIAEKNSHMHQRLTTLKPSAELRRTETSKDFERHREFILTRKRLPVKAG